LAFLPLATGATAILAALTGATGLPLAGTVLATGLGAGLAAGLAFALATGAGFLAVFLGSFFLGIGKEG